MDRSQEKEMLPEQTEVEQVAPSHFQWVEGRRHLVNAPYVLPKDGQETNRLDLQHVLLSEVLGSNTVAPIENPMAILDVGCGTGRWCYEMALAFPHAQVIGVDVVVPEIPTWQEDREWPHNCHFVKGNVLQGLPFADESFDVVHQRLLMAAIPAEKWQGVVNELARVTQPGGWIELIESDGIFPRSGPSSRQISEWLIEATSRRGIDVRIGKHLEVFLQRAGVEPVTSRILHIPMGNPNDPNERLSAEVVLALYQSLRPIIVASLHVNGEEYDRLLERVPAELVQYNTANPFYICYGQRAK